MRTTLRKLLDILDGKPDTVIGARGQSLVELTLTLPILMLMILGLSEIGWFANNYITLLDVVREAGRFGATKDPTLWADGEELSHDRLDCEEISTVFDKLPFENNTVYPGPDGRGYTQRGERPIGFYDGVACSVIGNMAPLEFDDDKDDIVVSVFSYAIQNPDTPSAQVRVVGRYPAFTNECENDDQYDPFDANRNGSGGDPGEDSGRYDAGWDNIRGYVFRGNHNMDYGAAVTCLGSEFSTLEVERMLNFDGRPDAAEYLEETTAFGLVLVEVFWRHEQLFGLPFFNIGPIDEDQFIHVWTFYPVSSAEPAESTFTP